VFNHFPTKEELFFDGRVPWLEGPAAAVRSRGRMSALTALRAHLVAAVGTLVESYAVPAQRRYFATLESSDSLQAHEREIGHDAEQRLRAALADAWSADAAAGRPVPSDPVSVAELVAALWIAGVRSIIVGKRLELVAGADPDQVATAARDMADRVLGHLEESVRLTYESDADTGWPQETRRAG
jgi:AcrR family transcriptional regulator